MYKNNNKLLATGRVEKKPLQQQHCEHDNFPYEQKSKRTKEARRKKKRTIISMANKYTQSVRLNRLHTASQVKRISEKFTRK